MERSLLDQFTQTPAINNMGSHFDVVDNNRRNVLARKDVNMDAVMRCIRTTHPELTSEQLDKIYAEAVAEMQVKESRTK